jgi:hypothetical protein
MGFAPMETIGDFVKHPKFSCKTGQQLQTGLKHVVIFMSSVFFSD